MNKTYGLAFLLLCMASAPARAGIAFYDPIYGTTTQTNITYGTGLTNNGLGSANLQLDLYQPTDIGQGALPNISPGIVLIHGGGFTSGNKSSMASQAIALTHYGYTVVSINYRLFSSIPPWEDGAFENIASIPFTPPSPPYASLPLPAGYNTINAAVLDATKAINWMKSNATLYDIDPNHIAVGGFSAGAVTSLLMGYIANDPEFERPQAILSFSGSAYGSEAITPADVPPAFIVHGTNDTTVPYSGSLNMANKLTSLGVYNEFYTQTGVGHTTNFNTLYGGVSLFDHQIEFLRNTLVPVPEPASVVLGAIGLVAVLGVAWRRRDARPRGTHAR